MVKGQILDEVVRAVDVVVTVLKGRLNDKGRGISSLGGRSVIRACVTALCLDVGNVAVL